MSNFNENILLLKKKMANIKLEMLERLIIKYLYVHMDMKIHIKADELYFIP